MVDSGSVSFYVVFSDGNNEMNVGTIMVDTTMDFKGLLSILSKKIGISIDQFNVFLATVGSDRRIPITAKFNLAAVLREGGKYYFVVQRSRNSKKSPPNGKNSIQNNNNRPENIIFLHRDAVGDETAAYLYWKPPLPRPPIRNRAEYERRMMNFQTKKESFLLTMGINGVSVTKETPNGSGSEGGGVVCEVCSRAKLTTTIVNFHLCVHDEITIGFRTMAGPISRPTRNSAKKAP